VPPRLRPLLLAAIAAAGFAVAGGVAAADERAVQMTSAEDTPVIIIRTVVEPEATPADAVAGSRTPVGVDPAPAIVVKPTPDTSTAWVVTDSGRIQALLSPALADRAMVQASGVDPDAVAVEAAAVDTEEESVGDSAELVEERYAVDAVFPVTPEDGLLPTREHSTAVSGSRASSVAGSDGAPVAPAGSVAAADAAIGAAGAARASGTSSPPAVADGVGTKLRPAASSPTKAKAAAKAKGKPARSAKAAAKPKPAGQGKKAGPAKKAGQAKKASAATARKGGKATRASAKKAGKAGQASAKKAGKAKQGRKATVSQRRQAKIRKATAQVKRATRAKAAAKRRATAASKIRQVPTVTVRGITVHRRLAGRTEALLRAADRAGLRMGGWGYRSTQRQIQLRRQHCGKSRYAMYKMPSGRCWPPTAPPGKSMHEKGLAIDFYVEGRKGKAKPIAGTREFRWLKRNAHKYGFYNLPSEPWHWSTNGR
jgi:LAS superfamily LD-carboxypeptidase LdcB